MRAGLFEAAGIQRAFDASRLAFLEVQVHALAPHSSDFLCQVGSFLAMLEGFAWGWDNKTTGASNLRFEPNPAGTIKNDNI